MGRQPKHSKIKKTINDPVKWSTRDKPFRVLLKGQADPKHNGIRYVSGDFTIEGKRVDGKQVRVLVKNQTRPKDNGVFHMAESDLKPLLNSHSIGYYAALENARIKREHEILVSEKDAWGCGNKNVDDNINHPPHYTTSGSQCTCGKSIECIDVTRHLNFNIGNAIKYLWRCDHKGAALDDLKKAAWYINDEIKRREKK